jgi:hypothetical protein
MVGRWDGEAPATRTAIPTIRALYLGLAAGGRDLARAYFSR